MLVRVILAILTAPARAVCHEVGSSGNHMKQSHLPQTDAFGKQLG